MFGSCQSDTFGAESDSCFGVFRIIGVGSDVQGSYRVGHFKELQGRSGLDQVVEAAQQLRGTVAPEIQVERNKVAMAQSIGGSGATVITTILQKNG